MTPANLYKKSRRKDLTEGELEELGRDPEWSFEYAAWKNGRFHQGELAIASSAWSHNYVKCFISGRWEHEDVYLGWVKGRYEKGCSCSGCNKDLHGLILYSSSRGRWDKLEKFLLKTGPEACLEYHRQVMNGDRWHDFEKKLCSFKGRQRGFWGSIDFYQVLESYLSRASWEDGRNLFILNCSGEQCVEYCSARWSGLEVKFLEMNKKDKFWGGDYWSLFCEYFKKVGRLDDMEEFMSRAPSWVLYEYHKVTGLPLSPLLHRKMMMLSFSRKRGALRYFRSIGRKEEEIVGYLSTVDEETRGRILCRVTNS